MAWAKEKIDEAQEGVPTDWVVQKGRKERLAPPLGLSEFPAMKILTDSRCCSYESPGHPERSFRVEATARLLKETHPDWDRPSFDFADQEALRLAHSEAHLARLEEPRRFDEDTDYHEGIFDIARLACGAGLKAMELALEGEKAFSLMRPPGHHAERERVMGFCYLSNMAICALAARARGVERVAVWDFDVHHGNGTQQILQGEEGVHFASVHQHPCFPGTGTESVGNCLNYPVNPGAAPEDHMQVLRRSWNELLAFHPHLILVSAGFDAYEGDPIAQMTIREEDFAEIGGWLGRSDTPTAALLEGGYSEDLPRLVESFLAAWEKA